MALRSEHLAWGWEPYKITPISIDSMPCLETVQVLKKRTPAWLSDMLFIVANVAEIRKCINEIGRN